MHFRAFAPLLALLAVAAAHPHCSWHEWHHGDHDHSRPSGPKATDNEVSAITGDAAASASSSATVFPTSTSVNEITTDNENPKASRQPSTESLTASVNGACVPSTTTKTVIVYETVTASRAAPTHSPEANSPSATVVSRPSSHEAHEHSSSAKASASEITSSAKASAAPTSSAEVSAITSSAKASTIKPSAITTSQDSGATAISLQGTLTPATTASSTAAPDQSSAKASTEASTRISTDSLPESSTERSTERSTPTSTHASAKSSTQASSQASTPATQYGSSKRGIITNPLARIAEPFTHYPKISWDMNWWEGAPPGQSDNWDFVPQLTHTSPDEWWGAASFHDHPREYPYVAGFLEPEKTVSIDDAVASWKKYLEPLAVNHTLIPPMVGQNGLGWLQNFTEACTGCTLDKGPIAFTIYDTPDEGGMRDFGYHVQKFKDAYPGRDLWVANAGVLGGQASDKDTEWMLRQVVELLENEPAVTRYAWNGADTFWDDSTSGLSALAKLYATL